MLSRHLNNFKSRTLCEAADRHCMGEHTGRRVASRAVIPVDHAVEVQQEAHSGVPCRRRRARRARRGASSREPDVWRLTLGSGPVPAAVAEAAPAVTAAERSARTADSAVPASGFMITVTFRKYARKSYRDHGLGPETDGLRAAALGRAGTGRSGLCPEPHVLSGGARDCQRRPRQGECHRAGLACAKRAWHARRGSLWRRGRPKAAPARVRAT